MTMSEIFLWPGTKACERLGVDPEGEAGLIRWMVNTLVYLVYSDRVIEGSPQNAVTAIPILPWAQP